jgi:hypothetical protein
MKRYKKKGKSCHLLSKKNSSEMVGLVSLLIIVFSGKIDYS